MKMSSSNLVESLVYTEAAEDNFEPTQEDIEEFAKRIGIDILKEPHLFYLAREGLEAKLPEPWRPCLDTTRNVWFYYNSETQNSQWEHPMNLVYRDKVTQARADLAMNRIQNFDPVTSRPPKSLPPLKKAGASLAPFNSAASSLGKLGGFGPAAGDLRQTAPHPSNNNKNGQDSTNNNQISSRPTANSAKIISGSSLNSFKDLDDDDSPPLVRPQKRTGLTLTGGGANFLKGQSSEGFSKLKGSTYQRNKDRGDGADEANMDPDKKPIKSILVNSISRSRPTDPSDIVYELDGFSMNLEEMTDDEKMVLSQLESTSSKAKGNVKFNLDENTELKFELSGDENDDLADDHNPQQNDDTEETEEEEEDSERSNKQAMPGVDRLRWSQNGSGDSDQVFIQRSTPSIKQVLKKESTFEPEYSDAEISAMKKSMREEMEEELRKFKEQLEKETKSRKEQIQKHLEETVAQFKVEKEDMLKKIKKDMENEKNFEVDKAKREIDSLLQRELEEMKKGFDLTLQQRQKELEEVHQRRLEELAAEYKKKDEENMSEVIKQQVAEETESEFKKHKEGLRENHKKQIMQMKDYHKTILDKLKIDFKAEEEKLHQDHLMRQAELVSKFEKATEDLKMKLTKKQDDVLHSIKEEFKRKKAALEKSLDASLQEIQEHTNQNKRSASETNISDKAAEDELRALKAKYQDLEAKYLSLKTDMQGMAKDISMKKRAVGVNNKLDKKSLRSGSSSPIPANKPEKNESFDISDTNQDSAHGSESNTVSNSSLYPSSDVVGSRVKEADLDELVADDSTSHTNRINAALQALEVLKKEILDLKSSKGKKVTTSLVPQGQTINDSSRKSPIKSNIIISKSASARKPTKHEVLHIDPRSSTRKKVSQGNALTPISSKSARKVSPSPPTHDTDTIHPKLVSRSVSVVPQDLSDPNSEPISEDTHQRIVEEAKAFIRMQKNRLNDPTPIPDSSHLIPKPKNNSLLFDEKLFKSVTPRRPTSIHLDLFSETESSGVSSLKDHRSSESKKLSKDIDEICNSLNTLDQQMKLMWSVVKGRQDESSLATNHNYHSSDMTAMLPNTVPLLLGKSIKASASLPASARKPLVPPPSPAVETCASESGKKYSSLLTTTPSSSSQTVLDALRMSGLSVRALDCTDLLDCLEDELKDFKETKQKLQEIQQVSTVAKKVAARHNNHNNHNKNSTNNNLLEKTKELQEWSKNH